MQLTKGTATLASLALLAPQAASAAPVTQPAAPPPTGSIICKTQTVTGSRIATKRVCGTAEEWAERRLQDRQAIEKVQTQPCVLQTTGASGRPSC